MGGEGGGSTGDRRVEIGQISDHLRLGSCNGWDES